MVLVSNNLMNMQLGFLLVLIVWSSFVVSDDSKNKLIGICPNCYHTEKAIYFHNNDKHTNILDQLSHMEEVIWKEDEYQMQSHHVSCGYSAQKKFKLSIDDKTMPVIVMQPFICHGPGSGNVLGFYFELLGFALQRGLAVALTTRNPRLTCKVDSLNDMTVFLPRLMIPYHHNASDLDVKECGKMIQYASKNPESLLWSQLDDIGLINNQMVLRWDSNVKGLLSAQVHLEQSVAAHTIAVHFRCGDNLDHPAYGLIPLSQYRQILQKVSEWVGHDKSKVLARVAVTSELDLHGPYHGELCTLAVAELTSMLKAHPFTGAMEVSLEQTSASLTYFKLHMARVAVCGVSTFCSFARIGSRSNSHTSRHSTNSSSSSSSSNWSQHHNNRTSLSFVPTTITLAPLTIREQELKKGFEFYNTTLLVLGMKQKDAEFLQALRGT